jgi:hypothetical protein
LLGLASCAVSQWSDQSFAEARVTLRRVESGGAEPHTKGIGRMSKIRFIGLDVHAATIAIAIAEPNGEVHSVGVIPNRLESIRKAMASSVRRSS